MLTSSLPVFGASSGAAAELAIKGGTPVRTSKWTHWPVWDPAAEKPMMELLRSEAVVLKHHLDTARGTAAEATSIRALAKGSGETLIAAWD